VRGKGHVKVFPKKTCYRSGENIKLTAKPNSGWKFDHWGGDLSGRENPVSLVITKDTRVIAYFTRQTSSKLPAAPNKPPLLPSSPSPEIDASNVSLTPTLSWTCTDPDGDPVTYDVYLSPNADYITQLLSECCIAHDLSASSISVNEPLMAETIYYWRVVAKDKEAQTPGPIWYFKTRKPTIPPHNLDDMKELLACYLMNESVTYSGPTTLYEFLKSRLEDLKGRQSILKPGTFVAGLAVKAGILGKAGAATVITVGSTAVTVSTVVGAGIAIGGFLLGQYYSMQIEGTYDKIIKVERKEIPNYTGYIAYFNYKKFQDAFVVLIKKQACGFVSRCHKNPRLLPLMPIATQLCLASSMFAESYIKNYIDFVDQLLPFLPPEARYFYVVMKGDLVGAALKMPDAVLSLLAQNRFFMPESYVEWIQQGAKEFARAFNDGLEKEWEALGCGG
jgi:hypothetical protein